MINFNKKNLGFTLIEVLIACSIISISIFTLMQTSEKSIQLSGYALDKVQASLLLEEGVEAVKSIRDNSFADIESLSLDTPYYLFFNTSTNVWKLDNSTATSLSGYIPVYPVDGTFIRTVTISAVERNSDDDIVDSGGTLDTKTKKVTVSVTWDSYDGVVSKDISFYLSDIFN